MLKKCLYYVKIFISVLFILSLILPSYAALSASDGSAFVTKAEFDSALADFNARLTTFEAGINSKIDSQVTSYLDRNGIWSGKDQVLSFNESNYFGLYRNFDKDATMYVHSYDQQAYTWGSRPTIGLTNDITNIVLIENINKSGLLWINSNMEPLFEGSEGANTNIRLGSNISDKYTFNNTGLLELWSAIDRVSKTSTVREWFWQKLQQAFAGVTLYPTAFNEETVGISFFVQVGDKVLFSAGVNKSGQVDGIWDGGDVKWEYRMVVNSAKVY